MVAFVSSNILIKIVLLRYELTFLLGAFISFERSKETKQKKIAG